MSRLSWQDSWNSFSRSQEVKSSTCQVAMKFHGGGLSTGKPAEASAPAPFVQASQHRSWREIDPTRYFFYGTVASMSIDFLFYPLKLVKTRLQVQGSSITSHSKTKIYPSTWSSLVKIKKMEGYRGTFSNLLQQPLNIHCRTLSGVLDKRNWERSL